MVDSLEFQRGTLRKLARNVQIAHALNSAARVLRLDTKPYREIKASARSKRRDMGEVEVEFHQVTAGRLPTVGPEELGFPPETFDPRIPQKLALDVARQLSSPLSIGTSSTTKDSLMVEQLGETAGVARAEITMKVRPLQRKRWKFSFPKQ